MVNVHFVFDHSCANLVAEFPVVSLLHGAKEHMVSSGMAEYFLSPAIVRSGTVIPKGDFLHVAHQGNADVTVLGSMALVVPFNHELKVCSVAGLHTRRINDVMPVVAVVRVVDHMGKNPLIVQVGNHLITHWLHHNLRLYYHFGLHPVPQDTAFLLYHYHFSWSHGLYYHLRLHHNW